MKRLFALLTAVVILFSLCACKRSGTSEEDENRELLSQTVLTLDGVPVTYETYRYFFYGIAYEMSGGDLTRFESDPELLAELREAVLDELRMEQVLRTLAEQYGIAITDENWAEIDRSIEELEFSYQTSLGVTLEESIKERYGTKKLFREMLAYGNYISDPVYEYIYDRDHGVIDFSQESIERDFSKYHCALHVLLTKKGYETEENALKTANGLYALLSLASAQAAALRKEEQGASGAIGAIDLVTEAYENEKSTFSFIGRFSPYFSRLEALKSELSGQEHAAFNYLKTAAGKIKSSETAVTCVQALANDLASNGAQEDFEKDFFSARDLYKEKIDNEVLSYFMNSTAYPSSEELDVLWALDFAKASVDATTVGFTASTLEDAFANAVRIFGEDTEDPEHGVYFIKGSTDEDFEKAFFELEIGQISLPVTTRYGVHLIKRMPGDFEFFAENLYEGYAVQDMLEDLMAKITVEYTPLYETVTPATLK